MKNLFSLPFDKDGGITLAELFYFSSRKPSLQAEYNEKGCRL